VKVFLGGTCNNSTWRDEIIPKLEELDIEYFNPVVEDWTKEAQKKEQIEKDVVCRIHLYVITSLMTGVFSIAEAVQSSNTDKHTIFCVLREGFDEFQLKSLDAVGDLIYDNNGIVTYSLDSVVEILSDIS